MQQDNDMRNIGPVSRQWLTAVGITNLVDLKAVGSVEAYSRVTKQGFGATLNLLWALEGALRGVPWLALTLEDKQQLRKELEQRG